MTGFRFILGITSFLIAIVTLAWSYQRETLITFAVQSKLPQEFVIYAPNRCEQWIGSTTALDETQKKSVWDQIFSLATLDQKTLKERIENPTLKGVMIKKILNSESHQTRDEVRLTETCLQKLIVHLQTEPLAVLNLFKAKNFGTILAAQKGADWWSTVIEVCRGHDECLNTIFDELKKEKRPLARQAWIDMLSEIGAASGEFAINKLQGLNGLGFDAEDTESSQNSFADTLVQIVVASFLGRKADLVERVNHPDFSDEMKWRIVKNWIQLEGPQELIWPIIENLLKNPKFSHNGTDFILKSFGAFWPQHPELITHLTQQIGKLNRAPAHFQKSLQLIRQFIPSGSREPQAITTTIDSEARKHLNESIQKLTLRLKASGVKNEQWQEFNTVLQNAGFFKDTKELVDFYLQEPKTADLGFQILMGENGFKNDLISEIRQHFDQIDPKNKYKIFLSLKDQKLRSILTPTLNESSLTSLMKSRDGNLVKSNLQEILQDKDLPISYQIEFKATALFMSVKTEPIKELRQTLAKNFKCDENWMGVGQNLIQQGPLQPLMASVTLQVLKCPEELYRIDDIAKIINSPKGHLALKKELNLSKSNANQLKKLTELLGLANNTPGSSLPPKVKTGG